MRLKKISTHLCIVPSLGLGCPARGDALVVEIVMGGALDHTPQTLNRSPTWDHGGKAHMDSNIMTFG